MLPSSPIWLLYLQISYLNVETFITSYTSLCLIDDSFVTIQNLNLRLELMCVKFRKSKDI